MLETTGCAGVSVGRMAIAQPWLFREWTSDHEPPADRFRDYAPAPGRRPGPALRPGARPQAVQAVHHLLRGQLHLRPRPAKTLPGCQIHGRHTKRGPKPYPSRHANGKTAQHEHVQHLKGDAMKTIDLSHVIRTGMPVYPGDETPNVRRTHFIGKHGFAQTGLALSTHVGTPRGYRRPPLHRRAHPRPARPPTTSPAGRPSSTSPASPIPSSKQPDLAPLADIDNLDFALLHTGWDQHWQTDRYYKDFPTLSETAARFLAGLNLKGVGLDTPSPDPRGLRLPARTPDPAQPRPRDRRKPHPPQRPAARILRLLLPAPQYPRRRSLALPGRGDHVLGGCLRRPGRCPGPRLRTF